MRWLMNIDKDDRTLHYLRSATVGRPQATGFHSVERLEAMGLVGIYTEDEPEPVPDVVVIKEG